MRHFDEQILGGIALHKGLIAEMKTGEGKTLMSTLAAYLNGLEEKGVYSSSNGFIRLLVDEAPECYKESSLIIDRIKPTIEIIDHLKPFINIKSSKIEK